MAATLAGLPEIGDAWPHFRLPIGRAPADSRLGSDEIGSLRRQIRGRALADGRAGIGKIGLLNRRLIRRALANGCRDMENAWPYYRPQLWWAIAAGRPDAAATCSPYRRAFANTCPADVGGPSQTAARTLVISGCSIAGYAGWPSETVALG